MKQLVEPKTLHEMNASARNFITKFGFTNIDVDTFDMFIIDHELANDPQTSDKNNPAHKGFVQERSVAKTRLNAAGARIDQDDLFQIRVDKDRRYYIEPYSQNSEEFVTETGNVLRRRMDNRMAANLAKEKRVIRLYKRYPENLALQHAVKAIQINREAMKKYIEAMHGQTLKMDAVMIKYEQLMLAVDADKK